MPMEGEFLVDFVIGGTQKGGTTALASFLGSHPEICLPTKKEVHFFDDPAFPRQAARADLNALYRATFPNELHGRVAGDATPVYMYLPWIAPRIREYNPAMKWILLLRDPVERAISHYAMERGRGTERLPFGAALALERFRLWRDRSSTQWDSSMRTHSYMDRGFYSRQIANIWHFFPRERVLVLTNEELRMRHVESLQRVHSFLGVDDSAYPDPETVFATEDKPLVSGWTRALMKKRFAADILRLEKMLGRSFEEWGK